jgi:feruloyl-CoA synthase
VLQSAGARPDLAVPAQRAPSARRLAALEPHVGGNHNLGQVLAFGGTLYIDDGKPTPQLFERTVDALRQHPPTVYYNVPAGFALLAPRLEQDRASPSASSRGCGSCSTRRPRFPRRCWERMRALADDVADRAIPLTSSWGATESGPAATSAHFASVTVRLHRSSAPRRDGEAASRTATNWRSASKGPNVTPGYHANPEATAAAFDDEGFYRTGDAVRAVNPEDPSEGLMFDGRIAEDFKLVTGTWVHRRPAARRTRLGSPAASSATRSSPATTATTQQRSRGSTSSRHAAPSARTSRSTIRDCASI